MSYTVLARKYRPRTFDDVVGQDPITQTLKNAIINGKVAHAYLFTGTRGVGKTTMARILAKSLNCLTVDAPTPQPCCKCESCVAINEGEDLDVIEIDGASNRSIDNIRELRQNAIYRPARSRFKIYIIDEVHMLTTEAFNALLKTLEEPPSHVKFIFATTAPNKVLATIRSRCQRFDFNNISVELIAKQIRNVLGQEAIEYEDDLTLQLAKMANGSMRDGLSLLDRLISTGLQPLTTKLLREYLGCPDDEKIYELITHTADGKVKEVLQAVDNLISSGLSEIAIVNSLIDHMRDLMVAICTSTDNKLLTLTVQQRDHVTKLVGKFDVSALVYNITTLEKLRWSIKNSDAPKALLEACLVRFTLSEHFLNTDSLILQLSNATETHVKKKPNPLKTDNTANTTKSQDQKQNHFPLSSPGDLNSVKANWENIVQAVADELGPGIAGLLKSAVPNQFNEGTLTLEYPSTAHISNKLLESSGRVEALESLISRLCNSRIKLEFGTASPKNIVQEKKNEIVDNPAVKTVLIGLDAMITGIQEY